MFGKRYDLVTVLGITLRIDSSWLVVAALLSWMLTNSFAIGYSELSTTTHWIMGLAGVLGLFGSVVLHEFGHAIMARQVGLSIRGITLFFFGGVAEMDSEPPSPGAEFLVAVAGPAVSFLLAIACFVTYGLFWGVAVTPAALGVIEYLGLINLALLIFNLVPAFPLDGGRVLRSALWYWKRDLRWATSIASRIGRGFGTLMIAIGIIEIIARQDMVGGLWKCLIGMFLRNAAQASYRQVMLRRNLEGESVRRFLKTDPIVVPRAISIADLVENYVYKYHLKLFPVVDNDRLIGCVATEQIKGLPQIEWARQSVGTIVTPCSPTNTISPDTGATAAMALMSRTGTDRLLVVEDGRLVGIITLKDLLEYLTLKVELEGDRSALTGSN
jgi:Zn-dependent protease/CBS domain-containing protein